MAERKPAKRATQQSAKSTTGKASKGTFTDEERAAMKERAKELKGAAGKADGESEQVLAKIAPRCRDRVEERDGRAGSMLWSRANRLHARRGPEYGMSAYAKDGNVVCFFQGAQKFKSRYATLGFSDKAKLDDGDMWPTAFALKRLTAADKARPSPRS